MSKLIIGLSITIILLIIFSGLYISRASFAENRLSEAKELSINAKNLLKTLDIYCSARNTDFIGVSNCLKKGMIKNNFKINNFINFNNNNNKTGYIVLINKGIKSYLGKNFTLLKNGKVIKKGCHILGDIKPGYTCKFDLSEFCDTGDVLEIKYNNNLRVGIKNC